MADSFSTDRSKSLVATAGAGLGLSGLRSHNRRRVADHIVTAAPISRTELARRLGLSGTAISAIVGELLEWGIVREVAPGSSGGGRPPTLLDAHTDRALLLGLEMGPDLLRAVVCDPGGRILQRRQRDTLPTVGVDELVATCLRLGDEAVAAALETCPPDARLLAVGVACSGTVLDDGTIFSFDLPDAPHTTVPLGEAVADHFAVPVAVDNDANLGALAELRFGAGRELQNVVYLLAHAGLGAGLILNGALYGGFNNVAGEIGHTVIDPDGAACTCGNYGCLETLVSNRTLAQHVIDGIRLGRPSSLTPDPDRLDAATVIDAAVDGDRAAVAAVERLGEHLGLAAANLANILSPQAIVLGGPLARLGDTIVGPIAAIANQRAVAPLRDAVAFLPSALGADGPALGACAAAVDRWISAVEAGLASSAPDDKEPKSLAS